MSEATQESQTFGQGDIAKIDSSGQIAFSAEDIKLAYSAILDGTPLPKQVVGDPLELSKQIAQRVINAETFEDAFASQGLPSWTDFMEVPVLVQKFHLNPTAYVVEGSPSVYAVVDISSAVDGEVKTVTCGGRNVLAQLVKMLEMGWFNRPVKLVSKDTAAGYDALWLQSVETAPEEE